MLGYAIIWGALNLFLIVIFGLLPAHQLRHAVEAHKPNRWHRG